VIGAGNDCFSGLQRLAQGIEHLGGEFRQFVEKQDTIVSQRHFPRPRPDAAADEGRHGGGMVRGAERARGRQFAVGKFAGDRGDHRHVEKFPGQKRRQDRGQAAGQHRLAGAGRPDHQEVVAPGGGDFQRPLGRFLALDLAHVATCMRVGANAGLRPRQHLGALEMVGDRDQAARRQYVHILAGPGRFRPGFVRAYQPLAEPVCAHCRRQRPGHRRNGAVKGQFAEDHVIRHLVRRDHAERRHQRQGDRKVEMTALLGQVRRGEVDGDALVRQGEAGRDQGRLDPLPAFAHRLVRQADNKKPGCARSDMDLDIDRNGFDAAKGDCGDATDHAEPPEIAGYRRIQPRSRTI